jgi:NAD(P)-dependent dehydrogenase (short-subunit alcohol dehydrogenase family)
MGRPEDIARAIRFLALEGESSFVAGECLMVDGGRAAQLIEP